MKTIKIKAKFEQLHIGQKVWLYNDDPITQYIREIDSENIYISEDTLPNIRIKIPIHRLGQEFYELWIESKQLSLL